MNVVEALLTNTAFGYPRGTARQVKPYALAVLHQTANSASAKQERDYANRAGSMGPSATYYVDGETAVHAVDGTRYAAWGSGDLNHPNTTNPTVARIAAEAARGTSPNLAVWEQLEVCGSGAEPYSDADFETVAQIVAARARLSGLSIDRTTVLVHADLNAVSRASDPWPASIREARVARVIDRARAILGGEMRAFAITGPSGSIVVKGDSPHAAPTLDMVTAWPALKAGQTFVNVLPIRLAVPVPGGDPTKEDRVNGYLAVVDGKDCIVLAKDSTFTPPTTHKVGIEVDGVLRPATVTEV